MKTALYFGSFNPVHYGHLQVGRYILEKTGCDRLWFVVSVQNPFKKAESLAPETDRLRMVELALDEFGLKGRAAACDIELHLPKPSWTVDTLRELKKRFPEDTFMLVMGEDNLAGFEKWKEPEEIRKMAEIAVYPRQCAAHEPAMPLLEEAPLLDYDATTIRRRIREGLPVDGYVPERVAAYIRKHDLYR